MSLAHKTVLFARLVNVTLAANLIVLSNDVSLNPGPTRNLPAGTKGLRLFHLNIRSLRYKMDELGLFCDQHKPHVLAISETWLDDSFVDEEVSLQGYNLMRRDRDCVGGGVAVYVAEHLNYNRLKDPRDLLPDIDVESIWFELSLPKTKKILIGAVYKPPDSNASTFTESLEKILSNFTTNETETILLGDFNFNYMAPNSATKNFKRLTNLYQLKQLITKPTRITEDSRTLIDLSLTSRPELYETSVIPVGYSDHCAIVGIRKLHRVKPPPPRLVDIRNYKNYDTALFKDDLQHVPWDIPEQDKAFETPDEVRNSFRDHFLTVADKHAPVVTCRVRGKTLPWLTPEIKNLMQEREHFHEKAIRTKKEIHWSSYKRLRNAVTLKLRKEKSRYYSTRLSEDQNSKEMWKTLNKILPKKPKTAAEIESLSATKFNQYFTTIAGSLCGHFTDPSPPRVLAPRVDREFIPQNVSSAFVLLELRKLKSTKATGLDGIPAKLLKDAAQEVAKPIANLINLTFSTGEIPQEWKEAKVTPIFKSGEKDDVNNYRPISVLPLISKIMERAIQVQLVSFLTENNVLSEHQSGFRKRHSTQTAVTYLSDFIPENMDKQKLTRAVFIDLKKAFDLVNVSSTN